MPASQSPQSPSDVEESSRPGGQRTALLIVFATVCIDLLGFGLVMPLLPIYGRELTGGPGISAAWAGATLGLLMSSFSIMQFFFAPLWGRLSDRIGRRPVLLMSLAGSTVFNALLGVATAQRSLALIFAARIGAGIAGATIPIAQAYIADVTSRQRRTQGMALIGAAFGVGFTLGPLVGALALVLSQDTGMSPWPGYTAAGLSAIALTLAVFRLPEPVREGPGGRMPVRRTTLREALATPTIGLLLLTGFVAVFALANFEGSLSLLIVNVLEDGGRVAGHGSQLSWREAVRLLLVFAYIGVIQSLVQGVLVRRLANRINEGVLAVSGVVVAAAGFVLLALVAALRGNVSWLMAATAVEIVGLSMVYPAVAALLSRRTAADEQGGVLGIGESLSAIGRIAGFYCGVQLFFAFGPAFPYGFAAVLMAAAIVPLSVAVRRGHDWQPRVDARNDLTADERR